MMRLGAETTSLLQKRQKQALHPGHITVTAVVTTFAFAVVHVCCSSALRYASRGFSLSIILLLVGACGSLFAVACRRQHVKQPYRSWLTAGLCCLVAVASGFLLGESAWSQYSSQFYEYNKMASYVNIDPAVDKGRSYMDAGTMYFKEGSYVDREKAIAFHNGATYCVAPIVRGSGSLPKQTVDFWAVGVDCCGDAGTEFRCGDTSTKTRSGVRLLDDASQGMYMLGVQEWSATTGVVVEHPVFFRWTQDPISFRETLYEQVQNLFWYQVTMCFIAAFVASVLLHFTLSKFRIQ